MKKRRSAHWRVLAATLIAANFSASAFAAFQCDDMGEWLEASCRHLAQTYRDGNIKIMLSGFSWHLPMTYTNEKRDEMNEFAAGFGMGRTIEETNGDTRAVFPLASLDSHKNIEWNLGYSWSTFWDPREALQLGLGYTAMIIQRPDIVSGIPFPGALPLVSLRYQNASLVSTFIPTAGGDVNNGSVLYVFGRYTLK